MSVSARLIKETKDEMKGWNFTEDEIKFLREQIQDNLDNFYQEREIKDFIWGNLSETDPRNYDEDGLEIHLLIDEKLTIIQYGGGKDFRISFNTTDNIIGVALDKTDQRIRVESTYNAGGKAKIISYDDKKYSDYKKFFHNLKRQIDG